MLVRYVRVITRRGQLLEPVAVAVFVVWAQIDVVQLEVVLNMGTDRLRRAGWSEPGLHEGAVWVRPYMNVKRPKVAPELLLLVDTDILEVLVPEDDDTTLGDQQRQLILLPVGKLRQLQTAHLGANYGCNLGHRKAGIILGEEVRLVLFGDKAAVVELEGQEGWKGGCLVVHWKLGTVLILHMPCQFASSKENLSHETCSLNLPCGAEWCQMPA